jgi:hypothetical protein
MSSEPNNKWYQRNIFWTILIPGIAAIVQVFFPLFESIERLLSGEGKLGDLAFWTLVLLVLVAGIITLLVLVIRKNLLRNRRGQFFAAAMFVLYVLVIILFVPRPSPIETILGKITAEPGSIEKAGPRVDWWQATQETTREPNKKYNLPNPASGCFGLAWNVAKLDNAQPVDDHVVTVFTQSHTLTFRQGGRSAEVCTNIYMLTAEEVGRVQAKWLEVNEPAKNISWNVMDLDH